MAKKEKCIYCKKNSEFECLQCGTAFCDGHGDTDNILCNDCREYNESIGSEISKSAEEF
ncbi:MAG: hypothetical protein PHW96_01010 [Candidatus Nanoarchaeia archaeon]|nr:hypothetical protein [Candidatus Nanoarchaeia archaeon]